MIGKDYHPQRWFYEDVGCEEDTAPVPGMMDVILFLIPLPTPDELNNKSEMFPLFKMNILHFRGDAWQKWK